MPHIYGCLTGPAASSVLKTVGTVSSRMGVGTSGIRQTGLDGHESGANYYMIGMLRTQYKNNMGLGAPGRLFRDNAH